MGGKIDTLGLPHEKFGVWTIIKSDLRLILISLTFFSTGHLGVSFYFIVSGTVTLQREEKDGRTGEKHVQVEHAWCIVHNN